jgi:hypothetical protein
VIAPICRSATALHTRCAPERALRSTTQLVHLRAAQNAQPTWIEPHAKQLDEIAAIGDRYRFDRFAAPAASCRISRIAIPNCSRADATSHGAN